jgi:tRNA nucleotidyltransferase/poly(A) polymerase
MSAALGDRLAAAPAARLAREALGDAQAWIVGGAVRDAALGREVTDVDLVVAGDAAQACAAVGDAVGGPRFRLSEEFETWRVLDPEGAWHIDVAPLRGESIEADLAKRDFTINALAVPLSDPSAQPADPAGGGADLDAGRLRAVSERSFEDDPLRLIRAARIAAALELQIDPGTAELARGSARRAGEPAGERQLGELRLMLGGTQPLRGLALMDELGATAGVLPELESLRGVEQNPNHHLDVHGHTIAVLERLLDIEADLPAYAGEWADEVGDLLDEPLADEMTRRTTLRFAAVVHDMGKPATRGQTGDYITFIGHDRVGAEIATGLCERLRTSRRLGAYLAGITANHLRLGFLIHEQPLGRRRVLDYLRATDPDPVDVTLLTVADRLAARGPGTIASEAMVQAHLDLAREMIGEGIAWRRDGPPRAPLRGDELADALGIEPGPELGRLIAEVEAGVYAGEVRSADDAIALARSALSK